MDKLISICVIAIFMSACSSSKNTGYTTAQNDTQKVLHKADFVDLPPVHVLSTFEHEGIQIDILHAFGNPEKREVEIHYRIKNWGAKRNYVVSAKGNSLKMNTSSFEKNCVYLNGEEQCGENFTAKVQAKTDHKWYGKYVFKNVTATQTDVIDQIMLMYSDNQLNGSQEYAEFSNVPITWDAMYLITEAKKTPERWADDNQGLIMEIEKAIYDSKTRQLTVIYFLENLDGKTRAFHVNGRDNQLVSGGELYALSCAGITEALECDIYFDKKKILKSGESTRGRYVFKNVKVTDAQIIDRLVLRYNETVLNSRPYFAVFGQIPIEG